MGRTYKRNDTYKSNRPKSLREKRNNSNRNKGRVTNTNSMHYESSEYKQSDTNYNTEGNTNG